MGERPDIEMLTNNEVCDLVADIVQELGLVSSATIEGSTCLKACQEALRVLSLGLVTADELKRMQEDRLGRRG